MSQYSPLSGTGEKESISDDDALIQKPDMTLTPRRWTILRWLPWLLHVLFYCAYGVLLWRFFRPAAPDTLQTGIPTECHFYFR
jgi:hypothetical protein